ncbi:class I SAM-dependent methyltransferase [Oceanitalea stevensii]|uniref:Methyltransferase domain-containing protein n=1 Tax=Oceanitalea stevensii TaxID=2763072 RepID=A0ABR8YY72_9MICO|nr:class I SAM-dependent methyltransferase [Oceanitalea stevensii]MBD8061027.1 methyltransferase domain-containing protein [Oceanitalea stevensii]
MSAPVGAARATEVAADGPWAWAAAEWETFQAAYVPERATQLTVALDAVRDILGREPRSLLDLGTGTGSFARAARALFPGCTVTGLDVDPFLLELGRRAYPGDGVHRVVGDLRHPGWLDAVPRGGADAVDAVVTATTTHWLSLDVLARVYGEVWAVLPRGGVLVNVDTVPPGAADSAVGRHALARTLRRHPSAGSGAPTWPEFWRHVEAVPEFAPLLAARATALGPRQPRVFVREVEHAAALTAAGFRDVGTVWRSDASAVVVAVA